ncbi:DUF3048 domain-containing protein [Aquibacillus rhizosphaerae]|uniref:DUF3048 domain-containing protein n=1 Tax=Aquibacillus rhizosphaerae TaxID=3051431 RepID=A0ABT7LBT3_9BACI|nr:DUF3048 domain-containing protein [Aquibacillus sp. LR5S19]MDL4842035.1 DUF3048 domain-containing protein [Aquibacillus sp. LR5S19]
MRKKQYFLLFILLFLTVVAACSQDEQVTEEEPDENQQTEVEEPVEPAEPEFENVYPLTGVPTNDDVDNRIVSVMVNNAPEARPQTGLSKADMVFEILAEGSITRLLAMFHSEQPDVVGPVRSARPYYFNLADDYGALYVHHGAATFIENMLKAGAADYMNGMYYDNDGHLFKRESFRVAPHNSYALFDGIYEVAEEKGYDTTGDYEALSFLTEDEVNSISGDQAQEVSFSYNSSNPVSYTYDSENEVYLRYNGEDQTVDLDLEDLTTETPVELDNVFILETYHEVVDDQGRREVDLQSGGDAYLLQKGKVQELEWKNVDGHIVPFQDGEVVPFVQGKTWVNVIPEDPGLDGVSIK